MESIVIAEHCCGAGNFYGCFIPTQQQVPKVWFDLEVITEPWPQKKCEKDADGLI